MYVKVVNKIEDAAAAMAEGFIPVECSFGSYGSVIDSHGLDHHGEHSARPGVARAAYENYRGSQNVDSIKVVTTGAPDADATFCVAAMCGLIPEGHEALVAIVDRMDVAPTGVNLGREPYGKHLILWGMLGQKWDKAHPEATPAEKFEARVHMWTEVLAATEEELKGASDAERRDKAAKAKLEDLGDGVTLAESEVFGFDVWYEMGHDLIVAFVPEGTNPDLGRATIGVRDNATAERFFGPGGLLGNVFPTLGEGWGGREAIGGSPRDRLLTRDEVRAAALVVKSRKI